LVTIKINSWFILWYGLSHSIQIHVKYLFDGRDSRFDKFILPIISELLFYYPDKKVCRFTMKVIQKNNWSYERRLFGNEPQLCRRLDYYAHTRFESHWNICPDIHEYGSHHLRHVWIVADCLWLFREHVMLFWFSGSGGRQSSKSSNSMSYDTGPRASNKRIVQSLRHGKKKMVIIQFQYVNMCIVKTCAFGREICHAGDPCCNEDNVEVFGQTLHAAKKIMKSQNTGREVHKTEN
jgi:hypothetical protein